ncbi:hypothetical protein LOK49_LG11G01818 [Camellia lanceoleosa]|uniref:Uncharacterized protein n=1 Tax=Camellia lanceoleosa TaxID=1840588 RepID=A0ACC0G384_9ERIC|nr:hypothetical protein LOK49_LG11G01818 [Camellia lanceoleosa]
MPELYFGVKICNALVCSVLDLGRVCSVLPSVEVLHPVGYGVGAGCWSVAVGCSSSWSVVDDLQWVFPVVAVEVMTCSGCIPVVAVQWVCSGGGCAVGRRPGGSCFVAVVAVGVVSSAGGVICGCGVFGSGCCSMVSSGDGCC